MLREYPSGATSQSRTKTSVVGNVVPKHNSTRGAPKIVTGASNRSLV